MIMKENENVINDNEENNVKNNEMTMNNEMKSNEIMKIIENNSNNEISSWQNDNE